MEACPDPSMTKRWQWPHGNMVMGICLSQMTQHDMTFMTDPLTKMTFILTVKHTAKKHIYSALQKYSDPLYFFTFYCVTKWD